MMRPSNITMIRSDRDNTSLRSALTSSTGSPESRASTICWWMNSMAPMSTPRVGCAITSTVGSRSSSRATISFWALPPE